MHDLVAKHSKSFENQIKEMIVLPLFEGCLRLASQPRELLSKIPRFGLTPPIPIAQKSIFDKG